MAKKNRGQQPNAPELQQILLDSPTSQQPPHNPYYPNLNSITTTNQQIPPPPYSDLSIVAPQHSVPMSRINQQGSNTSYTRFSNDLPRQAPPPTVIVHQAAPHHDRRVEKYHRKVRKFNNELFIACLVAIGLSLYSYSLYNQRPCVNFLVHQPSKDISIKVYDVREMHLYVAYGSLFLLLISLAKCGSGESNDYSCYLFLVRLSTFIAAVYTGYLAYLAFYSPCTLKMGDLATNALKTLGSLVGEMPSPDKGLFGESNVIQVAQDDKPGALIFFMDIFNFILYFAAFMGSVC